MSLNELFSKLKGSSTSGNYGHAGVPGKVGGSAPGGGHVSLPDTFSTPQAKELKEEQDRSIDKIYEYFNKTKEDYIKETNEVIRKELSKADIKIRTSEKSLSKILDDGEIKNTFDTDSSSSDYKQNKISYAKYQTLRKEAEKDLFGINEYSPGSERPISGYFEEKEGAKRRFVDSYGSVSITLKPEVKNRSMFTDTDSLDFSDRIIPTPVNNPQLYSSVYLTSGMDVKGMWSEGVDNVGTYSEAQIFGGVKLKDIDRITFDSKPKTKVTVKLDKEGIPWSILR